MEKDKKYFTKHFEGKRTAIIDDEEFEFEVNRIVMAAEGLGALHFSKSPNCAIIDAGSQTLNVLYIINGSISKNDSHTINGGTINNDLKTLAQLFAKTCSNIDYDYPLITTGGKAEELKVALEKVEYEDVTVAQVKDQPSFYVNAVGLLLKYGKKFEAMFA
jgi:plasmid segregation protein ParM